MDDFNWQKTSSQPLSTTWIENLALEELNMDESGVVNFNDHLDPHQFLDESSINFMNGLRDRIEIYVAKFNEHRGNKDSSSQIKTFKISNTVNDFMLFRNSLRLIFARKNSGLISIGFLTGSGEVLPVRLGGNSLFKGPHEIKAHLGPFNDVTWQFQGEVVDMDALVRHYISEFIRNSAR